MNHRALIVATVCTIALIGAGGCSLLVNPFQDELFPPVVVETPSSRAVREAGREPEQMQRAWVEFEVATKRGAVTHAPLYFEDATEEGSLDDGRYAWKLCDYVQMFYWRGRFLVNLAALPISFISTPPWQVMESDGVPSRYVACDRLDARAVRAPSTSAAVPPAEPIDASEPVPTDAPDAATGEGANGSR
jgi:hypothetical protein